MNIDKLRSLLDEMEEKQEALDRAHKTWSEAEDDFSMAECDPSDQYMLECEIDALIKQIENELVVPIVQKCIDLISTEQENAEQNWQCKDGVHIVWKIKELFGVK